MCGLSSSCVVLGMEPFCQTHKYLDLDRAIQCGAYELLMHLVFHPRHPRHLGRRRRYRLPLNLLVRPVPCRHPSSCSSFSFLLL